MKVKNIENGLHDIFISICCGVISALIVLLSQQHVITLNLDIKWVFWISIFVLIIIFMIMGIAINFFKIIKYIKLYSKNKHPSNKT